MCGDKQHLLEIGTQILNAQRRALKSLPANNNCEVCTWWGWPKDQDCSCEADEAPPF